MALMGSLLICHCLIYGFSVISPDCRRDNLGGVTLLFGVSPVHHVWPSTGSVLACLVLVNGG